jgi:hypothetical protein
MACNPVDRVVDMVPLVSVIGCVLLAVGLWGSVMTLRRDGPRF